MRASCCFDRDLALAIRAHLGCRSSGLFFFLADRSSLVHSLDNAEKDESHDQEADNRVDEITDSKSSVTDQRNLPCAEILIPLFL